MSDARADRRRQKQALRKAQNTVQRLQGTEADPQAAQSGTPIGVQDLLSKIGLLTVEKDVLVARIQTLETQQQAIINSMTTPEEGEQAEQDTKTVAELEGEPADRGGEWTEEQIAAAAGTGEPIPLPQSAPEVDESDLEAADPTTEA